MPTARSPGTTSTEELQMTTATPKAGPKQVREFFEAGSAKKVTTAELMELKKVDGGKAYEQIAVGIGDGTLTY